jgi:hypothetical protein
MTARLVLVLLALAAPWLANAGAGTSGPLLEWQPPVEIAQGRGERGPWQQNESRYHFVDDPTVALNDSGDAAVAWVDQSNKDVFFQRIPARGGAGTSPVNVSRSPGTFSWLPRLALVPGSPDSLLLVWQEIIFSGGSHGGDILLALSADGGRTFSTPVNLSSSIGGDGKGRISRDVWHNGSFDLAAGPRGEAYVAWTEYDGPLWFCRSVDGGKSFSKPQQVADGRGGDPARAPSMALGRDGEVYLAWTVGENPAADIHLAKSSDGGRSFSAPRTVAASRNYSDAPKLSVDTSGVLHLVYAESSGGPHAPHHIRYTRSADGGRSFAAAREISGPLPAGARSAAYPALGVDTTGRLYVVFELFAGPNQASRGLALAVSQDGGANFSPPQRVPASMDAQGGFNGSSQGLLMNKLAVNPSGEIAIVNSSLKQGAASRVWLMRGRLRR